MTRSSVLLGVDLFLIDGYLVRFEGELLVRVLSVGLIPVLDSCSGSADAEPLVEITHSANETAAAWVAHASLITQAGVRVRSLSKNGTLTEPATLI